MDKQLIERLALEVCKAVYVGEETTFHRYNLDRFAELVIEAYLAEQGGKAVAYGVLEYEQGEPNPEQPVWDYICSWPEAAQEHINDRVQGQLDDGIEPMRYKAYPLFLAPQIPEGMALVPIERIQKLLEYSDKEYVPNEIFAQFKAIIAAAGVTP